MNTCVSWLISVWHLDGRELQSGIVEIAGDLVSNYIVGMLRERDRGTVR